jgi:WD40 repeat protein
MAVNGTGELLATSTDHATIKLWNVSTGALVKSLEGHTGAVSSLAFARNGNLLVSGSRDETLRIWDLDQVNFSKVLREPRPYEGLNIKDAMGLSSAQSDKLKSLGAVEI